MMIEIPGLLDAAALGRFRAALAEAPWTDGRATAGYQSAEVKRNLQLPQDCPAARDLGAEILAALGRNLIFQSAALPAAIFPPMFNLYRSGHAFGTHIDNAWRILPDGRGRLRTDLSATLFLGDPASYDGGELIVEDGLGERAIKLPAGHMILYPATTLHRVAPVTRGERLASFFWIQSLVSDMSRRALLFDMDMAIQSLRQRIDGQDPAIVALTGTYHNLVRQWSAA